MRPSSILAIAAAALAVLRAAPAAAQDEFTYAEIPWGIDARATTQAMAAQGFVLNTEFTPDAGELMYEDDQDVVALASFAGDALVGIRIAYAGTQEAIEEMFDRSVEDAVRNLGEPDERDDDRLTWRRGRTLFSLMVGESEHGLPFITVQYGGPGYEDEIERRVAALRQPLPALDARWTVLNEDGEQRVAFDRSTLRRVDGNVVRVWLRTDYTSVQPDESGAFDRTMNQVEYDCDDRQFRILGASTRLGDALVVSDATVSEWVAIVPETMGEDVLTAICAVRR